VNVVTYDPRLIPAVLNPMIAMGGTEAGKDRGMSDHGRFAVKAIRDPTSRPNRQITKEV